jgi:glycosyltransferase involved in cell wall biosynthesis
MKILMLIQFFSPTRGGGEVMFYQLANQLGKRGHKVFLIKHKILGSDKSEDYPNLSSNIIIYEVNPTVIHKGGLPAGIFQNIFYVLNSIKLGLKIILNERVDIIHCNSYSPAFAGWFLSKLTGVPLLVTIHDVASLYGYRFWRKWMKQFGRLSRIKGLIGYISELLTIKISRNIHTVSETSKNDILLFNSKCNVSIISNSLDFEYYKIRSQQDITYENIILFIGRLVYYKHLEVVIKAFKLLEDKINAKLVILGDGPMRNKWEKLINLYELSDKIEFKGYVPHEEKLQFLSRVRALVLPSIFEGFGIVVLEAWALKKPVIVADVKPLNEIVEHGKNGFIVNPCNPKEWVEYIKLLLENKDLARRMGENGYRELINKYTINKCVNKLEQLYRQIISGKS